MPYSAPSIRFCGCIVPRGKQCQHGIERERERKARADAQRPTARQRGYDGKWEKARAGFLAKHPRCFRCGQPATVVHHSIPHRGDRALFWRTDLWRPACKPCHDGVLQSEEKRR
jgi:5-methylcytosine-specific restriction endonuclease McrA